ncbi:MAG: cysteine desulfurase family protein, partial [Hyphomicrobiaceae bacterium]
MSGYRAYLDWNASAPLRREARDAMHAAMDAVGNPSSVHAEGRRVRAIVEDARREVAMLVGAAASEVVFTSGGTEANNAVLAGPWKRILVSGVEHESVLAPARRGGAEVVTLPVDRDGVVVPEAVARALSAVTDPKGTLLSIQAANNETGVIQPLTAIVGAAKAVGVTVHSDAVQAAGRVAIDFAGLDLMSISGHKLGAAKGVGALVVRDGAELSPLFAGGGQEARRRAGTENVVGIAGFGAAARAARDELVAFARLVEHRRTIERAIAAAVPGGLIVGAGAERLANTVCFTWPGALAEMLLIKMDLGGVAISSGAACSSGKVGPSHVLAAMGLPGEHSRSAFRVSFGATTDDREIAQFVSV